MVPQGSVGGWEEQDTWVCLREGDVGALKEARSAGRGVGRSQVKSCSRVWPTRQPQTLRPGERGGGGWAPGLLGDGARVRGRRAGSGSSRHPERRAQRARCGVPGSGSGAGAPKCA